MSIVERALHKMQGARKGAPNQVFGYVVRGAGHAVDGAAGTPDPASARRVSIDQVALRAAGLLAPAHRERQIANQYRQIKRPLIASALGRGKPRLDDGQIVMVASAMPGEGKTFTALNLALSMAMEKDVNVLIVDADVVKPQVSKMFGVLHEPGLLDALVDPAVDLGACILQTDVPHLSVLPAGSRNDLATELLSSERMAMMVRNLAKRDAARIMVFDSSPLLLTTESHALARIAGQIVVVVHAGHTQQHTLMEALSHLPEDAAVSLILNQSVGRSSGSYYYGYGEGRGPQDGAGEFALQAEISDQAK